MVTILLQQLKYQFIVLEIYRVIQIGHLFQMPSIILLFIYFCTWILCIHWKLKLTTLKDFN